MSATDLIDHAKRLLADDAVTLVIGYTRGTTDDRRRACFVRDVDDADDLVCDAACVENLATYATKTDLIGESGKVAIFLRPAGVRAMNVLAAENQIDADRFVILAFAIGDDGSITTFDGHTPAELSELAANRPTVDADVAAEVQRIAAMSDEERFEYWREQFSRCVKCYACRQVCPMCYCRRCVVEANQPQWVCASAHQLGNTEWNVVRAFHLAGRCVECDNCTRACPVGIRLDVLNAYCAEVVQGDFDYHAGAAADQPPVLASFKNDDDQEFIL